MTLLGLSTWLIKKIPGYLIVDGKSIEIDADQYRGQKLPFGAMFELDKDKAERIAERQRREIAERKARAS